MAFSIVEHNWANIPIPKNPDVREAQHLLSNGDGHKNVYVPCRPIAGRSKEDPAVIVDISYENDIEEEFYIYNRYGKLVRL